MKKAASNRGFAFYTLMELASRPLGVTVKEAAHALDVQPNDASSRIGKMTRSGRLKKIKDNPATYVVAESKSPGTKGRISDYLYAHGPSTLAELAEYTGAGQANTHSAVRAMLSHGNVVPVEGTNPTQYTLARKKDVPSQGHALQLAWYGPPPETFSNPWLGRVTLHTLK